MRLPLPLQILQAELDGVFENSPEMVTMIDPEILLRSEKNVGGTAPTNSTQDTPREDRAAIAVATWDQGEEKLDQTSETAAVRVGG